MQQLETDLNFIRSLPARPAMRTEDLQAEFDKAGNTIKDWINNIHIPELTLFQTEINTSIQTQIDTALATIRGEMDTLQTTLEGEMSTLETNLNNSMNTLENNVNSALAGKVAPGSFVLQTFETGTEPSVGYNTDERTITFNKSGYKALGVIGWDIVIANGDLVVRAVKTTEIGNGYMKVYFKTWGNTTNRNNGTFKISTLWVKI